MNQRLEEKEVRHAGPLRRAYRLLGEAIPPYLPLPCWTMEGVYFWRIGSTHGDTLKDLESWTTVELVALGKRIMEILAARRLKEAARAKSLANLLDGGKREARKL